MPSTDHFSYDEYDRLTRTYVDLSGSVNYARLKEELPALKDFIDQLGAASPENKPEWFPNEDERKRYYLTAYNGYIKRGLSNPHVAQYVALYLAGSSALILAQTPATALTIKYLDYDKELND